MNFGDGIIANGKHSYLDFGLMLKNREIEAPSKKNIRQTVPYMNGYYDFSDLNGVPAWNERKGTFYFDIIGDTPQEVEYTVSQVLEWLCTIQDTDIMDGSMYDYHWHGSYDSAKTDYDESGEACEIAVTFVMYPFKIANEATSKECVVGNTTVTNHGRPVAPTALSSASATIQIGSLSQTIQADTPTKLNIDLATGDNTVTVSGSDVTLSFKEEVF